MTEQTVVISLAAAETVASGIECYAGDKGEIYASVVCKDLAHWLRDVVATAYLEIFVASVLTKDKILVVIHTRQNNLPVAVFKILQSRDFVVQRGVEE